MGVYIDETRRASLEACAARKGGSVAAVLALYGAGDTGADFHTVLRVLPGDAEAEDVDVHQFAAGLADRTVAGNLEPQDGWISPGPGEALAVAWTAGGLVRAAVVLGPGTPYRRHVILDCLRELLVEWHNRTHRAKLVWEVLPAPQTAKTL